MNTKMQFMLILAALLSNSGMRALNEYESAVRNGQDCPLCDLVEANLEGLDLAGRNFAGANLYRASFIGANLAGANFTGASLVQTNFTNANLAFAELTGSDLRNAVFTNANIAGAIFLDADIDHVAARSLVAANGFGLSRYLERLFRDFTKEDLGLEPHQN